MHVLESTKPRLLNPVCYLKRQHWNLVLGQASRRGSVGGAFSVSVSVCSTMHTVLHSKHAFLPLIDHEFRPFFLYLWWILLKVSSCFDLGSCMELEDSETLNP